MKVTFVVSNYPPSMGGVQVLVSRLAEGLANDFGHDVEVITTDALVSPAAHNPGFASDENRESSLVRVVRYPLARRVHRAIRHSRRARQWLWRRRGRADNHLMGPLGVGPYGVRLSLAIVGACVQRDIVIGIAAPYTTMVLPSLAPHWLRAVRVSVPLLHVSDSAANNRFVELAIRRSDSVIALTSFESLELQRIGVSPEQVAILTPGCDVDRFPQFTSSEARRRLGLRESPTVGYVGRLASYKGIDTFLDASARILSGSPDTTILIAGAPSGWPGFEERLLKAKRDFGDNLQLIGKFAEETKPLIMSSCDIIVTPSRAESFGIVNIEAWAAGRPVVAGDIPSVRSLVRHGEDGLLVKVGDAFSLASAVTELLHDPDRAMRMGAQGHSRAVSDYDWGAVTSKWNSALTGFVDDPLASGG